MSSAASGATPVYLPPRPAPLPAMIEATWVPCPTVSSTLGCEEKFAVAAILPTRSGWDSSTPVSSTATLTPVPVNPACQAPGAPIRVTPGCALSFFLPSNQTLSCPATSASSATPLCGPAAENCPPAPSTMTGVASAYPNSRNASTSKSALSSRPAEMSGCASSGMTYRCRPVVVIANMACSRPRAGTMPTPERENVTRSPVTSVTWSSEPRPSGAAVVGGAGARVTSSPATAPSVARRLRMKRPPCRHRVTARRRRCLKPRRQNRVLDPPCPWRPPCGSALILDRASRACQPRSDGLVGEGTSGAVFGM